MRRSPTSPVPARISRPIARRGTPRPSSTHWRDKRFLIVASQFNRPITSALVRGAVGVLRRAGVSTTQIRLLWVPGAFELPVVAARMARRPPRPHAIIALGVIIRGQTPQYAVLAHGVAHGLSQVAVAERLPVTFGVVVADSPAQAKARAGGTFGNRGAEAARAALQVLRVLDGREEGRRVRSP